MVLVEKVFRGMKSPKPVQLDSTTYKADYMLIPKDQEHLYLESNVKLSEKKVLPRAINFPPLFLQLMMQRMKAKGITVTDEPKMTLKYNLSNQEKNYRIAEEGETPTVEFELGVNKSSNFFPKPEDAVPS